MKQKIEDFSHKKCCLNCNGFCWWDGDYCCAKEMKTHQDGILYPYGYQWMNSDIDKTMKTPETREDYKYAHHEKYHESDNQYIKEYKKFKEWDKLCKQLEDHVSDPSGIYKKFMKHFLFSSNLNYE